MTRDLLVRTVSDLLDVRLDAHLLADAEVPIITGLQRQGDVLVLPLGIESKDGATDPLTAAGHPVVRGENGGNTHTVHAYSGTCFYDAAPAGTQLLGLLTVAAGGSAILSHPEHGFLGIGAGSYTLVRQREHAPAGDHLVTD